MGLQGGQAAFGSSLFWSYTCSSNFDVSAPSLLGRAAATASQYNSTAERSNKSESNEISRITANETEIRGRGDKAYCGKRGEKKV